MAERVSHVCEKLEAFDTHRGGLEAGGTFRAAATSKEHSSVFCINFLFLCEYRGSWILLRSVLCLHLSLPLSQYFSHLMLSRG